MSDFAVITKRIEEAYSQFTPQLRKAARYVVKAPAAIALYPLRQVAAQAEVGPTTLVRLAERLGFSSYNAFRETFRDGLRSGANRYASDAQQLISYRAEGRFEALHRATAETILDNLKQSFAAIGAAEIEAAARLISGARRVYILGYRSNYAPAYYLYYVLRTFSSNVVLLEGRMGMLIDELGEIGPRDVLIAISYDPYAIEAVKAVEHAAGAGARVIALTDNTLSPIARHATQLFLVPTASASFYQSFVPTLALLESLVAHLAARGGKPVVERVKAEFERRERFGVYWRDRL